MRLRNHLHLETAFTIIPFSNEFYFSFMLGLVDLSEVAILCDRPNNCFQQNQKSFDQLLFFLGLSS